MASEKNKKMAKNGQKVVFSNFLELKPCDFAQIYTKYVNRLYTTFDQKSSKSYVWDFQKLRKTKIEKNAIFSSFSLISSELSIPEQKVSNKKVRSRRDLKKILNSFLPKNGGKCFKMAFKGC